MTSNILSQFQVQQKWRWETKQSSIEYRLKLLRGLRASILAHQADIVQALFTDFKKPESEVWTSEIMTVLVEISLILKNLKKWSRPKAATSGFVMFGSHSQIRREARGTVLIISPWNYPFCLAMIPLVSAIAAGNTVILKPSELTPATSALLEKILGEVFETNLVSVFQGGKEVSTELLKMPFDHIFFTGSSAVGKIVMAAAAKNLSSVTLELGGKCPVIVHSSCDLNLAAKKIAWGKFYNSGQTCVAPDYVFVEESIEQEFKLKLKDAIAEQLGGRTNAAIITEGHRDRLEELAREALHDGAATILECKKMSDGKLTPTLLENPSHSSRLMNEEIFGPILPITTFTKLAEATKYLQDRPKPLALYLFAKDTSVIEQVLTQTSSGGVSLNEVLLHVANHNLPFGGVGESGIGNYHGEAGFRTFTHERSILKSGYFFRFVQIASPPFTDLQIRFFKFLSAWL